MTKFTYYVVQPFKVGIRGKLVPSDPLEAESEAAAARMCEIVGIHGGALAFSRTGDPDTGDFDDAVVFFCFGRVPEQFGREAA